MSSYRWALVIVMNETFYDRSYLTNLQDRSPSKPRKGLCSWKRCRTAHIIYKTSPTGWFIKRSDFISFIFYGLGWPTFMTHVKNWGKSPKHTFLWISLRNSYRKLPQKWGSSGVYQARIKCATRLVILLLKWIFILAYIFGSFFTILMKYQSWPTNSNHFRQELMWKTGDSFSYICMRITPNFRYIIMIHVGLLNWTILSYFIIFIISQKRITSPL